MNKALKILLSVDFLVIFSGAMIGPFYAVFVIDRVGGDLLDAGISWSIFAVVSGIITLLIGKMTNSAREQELVIAAGYLISGLSFLGYLLVDSIWELFLIQVFLGIGGAISSPAYSAVYSTHLTKGEFIFQWGSWEGMNKIALGIGALAGGLIVSFFGFVPLFALMGALPIVSSVIILLLPRELL
jgi:MFS family permease